MSMHRHYGYPLPLAFDTALFSTTKTALPLFCAGCGIYQFDVKTERTALKK